MRKIPNAIYQTPAELDARIEKRLEEARRLPPGEPRQTILKEVARLRMYADAKRWIKSPELKVGR